MIVTLMYGTAYERYGRLFLESFFRFWPADTDITVVADRPIEMERGRLVDLATIPSVAEFRARYGKDAAATGRRPPPGVKTDPAGYSWRHDAVKWMPQAVVPDAVAATLPDGEVLCWLDADIETSDAVPPRWVEGLLGKADVACLKRRGMHSEIGFYAVRLGQRTRRFLRGFADLYESGRIFGFREFHSAYAFDRALAAEGLVVRNLSPGLTGHVFPNTVLARCLVHRKGRRKDL